MKKLCEIFIWCGHPALGALTLLIGLLLNWIAAGLAVWLYLEYEFSEERIINDKAYVDVKDFMYGFFTAAGIACAIAIARMIWD